MRYWVHMIFIGEVGDKVLDNFDDCDFGRIAGKVYDNIIVDAINLTRSNRKYHHKELLKLDSDDNTWFNILIYDNKDKDIVLNTINRIKNVEFLNIGICINGNDDIDNVRVIETKIEDASNAILNMLQPILNVPGLIGYDVYDIYNYFNTNSKYEIIHFEDLNNLDNVISYFNKYSNMTIEPMIILSTMEQWTLAKQSSFLVKIWNLKCVDNSIRWHLYFTDYIKKDLLTIIIKKHSNQLNR